MTTQISRPARAPRRGVFEPTFVIVAVILLCAGVGLNFTTLTKKLHFKKEAVPQPRDFHEIPAVMGHWMQISEDEKLDRETQDVLGTELYVYRDYLRVDTRGADLVAAMAAGGLDKLQNKTLAADDTSMKAADAARTKFNAASFDEQVAMI